LSDEYVREKLTYAELAERYNCSIRTIRRYLDDVNPVKNTQELKASEVLMDTTYFRKTFGVMLFKDAITGRNLLSKFVKYETNLLYYEGLQELISAGIEVIAVVCDGRRGLFSMFKE